jgi:hypothetical protein
MFQANRIRLASGIALAVIAMCSFAASPVAADEGRPDAGRTGDASSVEHEAYSVESKPTKAKVGKAAQLVVAVKAKGTFHLNQEYPHKLTLDGVPEGVRVEKTDLKRGDAELDEHSLTFKLEATPEKAGRHVIKATLKTSVCDEKQCILKSEKLSLRVVGK